MLVARILGVLAAITLGAMVLAYVVTGERKYLKRSWMIFRVCVFGVALILLLMLLERLLAGV